jgi:hypothetical protein
VQTALDLACPHCVLTKYLPLDLRQYSDGKDRNHHERGNEAPPPVLSQFSELPSIVEATYQTERSDRDGH